MSNAASSILSKATPSAARDLPSTPPAENPELGGVLIKSLLRLGPAVLRNGRYGTRDRLHWLDVGRHNHLAPFLGFVGDELAEISGRASKHRAAQIGKPCFEFWICNADIDFLVQSFDELCGRALRSTNAVPCTCLVVRQRVAQNRNVRQHIRPRRGSYGQGAEFAGPDI